MGHIICVQKDGCVHENMSVWSDSRVPNGGWSGEILPHSVSEQQLLETPHFVDLIFMTGLTLLLSAAIKLKTSSQGNN